MGFNYYATMPPSNSVDDILVLVGILLAFGVNATLVILAYVSAIKITTNANEATKKELVIEKSGKDSGVDGVYTDSKGNAIEKPELLVTIVRGVPGCGKTDYVYFLESLEDQLEGSDKIFSICDTYDYFYIDGEYYYRADQMDRAKEYCFSKFLNSIKDGVKRIYVLGNFQNTYMYQNYLDVAQEYGYSWKVDEMVCPNVDYLWLYNKRNKHGIPMKKSISIYNGWEVDEDANLVRPYIPTKQMDSWAGDCIPKYNCTKADLDRELTYLIYGVESREIRYRELEYDIHKMLIDVDRVSKKEKKQFKMWEITKVSRNNQFLSECSDSDFNEYFDQWGQDYCDAIYEIRDNVLENVYTNIETNTTYFHPYSGNEYI